ncbi:hypothetical protein ACKKBF_B35050 [Auxenochlorella protothecoides x Auxenochlorella symbiontica]
MRAFVTRRALWSLRVACRAQPGSGGIACVEDTRAAVFAGFPAYWASEAQHAGLRALCSKVPTTDLARKFISSVAEVDLPANASSEAPPPPTDTRLDIDFEELLTRPARPPRPGRPPSRASERAAAAFRILRRSGVVRDQALALYVNSALFPTAAAAFEDAVLSRARPRELAAIGALATGGAVADALFPAFARFVLREYRDQVTQYRSLVQTADLRAAHAWFPLARALQRRIVYHAGPTNSGKTYSALEAMKAAGSGVYCGPLRLLAMEVYDTCNAAGTFCDLITGQERREVPGSSHVSCTVEMVDLSRRVDVAVLDEIQMIGDEHRGWAWSRALMGVPANEIHLCGDGSAVELVRSLAAAMGDELEVRSYDRFTALAVEPGGLGPGVYAATQRGDCIVAFSRRDIFEIKAAVERETSHRCCVIYGALPPETRRQQAQLFNAGDNKYHVMVASDAVGMGLNLNIGRVVFHSLHKQFGGNERAPVSVSMIKQIAGRAGRRNSEFAQGKVTCKNPEELGILTAALETPLDVMVTRKAGLFPEFEHLEVFAGQRPDDTFSETLNQFTRHAVLDSTFFLCKQDGVFAAAQLLGETQLSLRDMYSFCMAPASSSNMHVLAALLHFARVYATGAPVTLDLQLPRKLPCNTLELRQLETAHAIVNLWLWLSYRFDEEAFPGREGVQQLSADICDLLHRGLRKVTSLTKASGSARASRAVDRTTQRPSPAHERLLRPFEAQAQALQRAQLEERRLQRSQQAGEGRLLRARQSAPCEGRRRAESLA